MADADTTSADCWYLRLIEAIHKANLSAAECVDAKEVILALVDERLTSDRVNQISSLISSGDISRADGFSLLAAEANPKVITVGRMQ